MVYVTTFSQCRAILVYVLQILMRQQHLVPKYECHAWSCRCISSQLNKPQTNIYEYILYYLVSGNFEVNMWGFILQYVLRILYRIFLLLGFVGRGICLYSLSKYLGVYLCSSSRLGLGVHYSHLLQFVSDLRQVGGFLWVLRFPPPLKLTATT
jgi:hypothetical protein